MNLKKYQHSNGWKTDGLKIKMDCGFLYYYFKITLESKRLQLDKLGQLERIDNTRGANIHRLI